MWHLSPSLTYSSRKFPHEFATSRERKQVILHKMDLNPWLRIQSIPKKK